MKGMKNITPNWNFPGAAFVEWGIGGLLLFGVLIGLIVFFVAAIKITLSLLGKGSGAIGKSIAAVVAGAILAGLCIAGSVSFFNLAAIVPSILS